MAEFTRIDSHVVNEIHTVPADHRIVVVMLAGTIVFQCILSLLWLHTDLTPPTHDEAWYLYQGAVQYQALQEGISPWYGAWTQMDIYRPSLVPTLTVPFYTIFGISNDAGLLVNVAAIPILLLATFALGKSIGQDSRVGLISALLVGSYPMMVGLRHILLVEFVMTTWVAVTLLALWRSTGFRHTKWSIVAGGLMGLGMLTKIFYPVFIVGPLFVLLLVSSRDAGRWAIPGARQLRNMLLTVAVALALALWWYVPNLTTVIERSLDAAIGAEGAPYGPSNPWHPQSLVAYFLDLVGLRISFLGFLLFLTALLGLGLTVGNRRQTPGETDKFLYPLAFLLSSILVSYFVFSSINNQDLKHIAGIMPAMAVLTAWGLITIVRPQWMAVLIAGVACLFLSFLGTFPGPLTHVRPTLSIAGHPFALLHPALDFFQDSTYSRPKSVSWPIYDVLAYSLQVADLETLPRDQVQIAVVPNFRGIEEHSFRFEALTREMPIQIMGAHPLNLHSQDVLIHKTGNLGYAPFPDIRDGVLRAIDDPESGFQQMPRTFEVIDGSEILIYARRPSPLLRELPALSVQSGAVIDHAVGLLGVDVTPATSASGETRLSITYYWASHGPTERAAKAFVHLLDPLSEDIIAQDDHPLFPQVYPTDVWQAGRILYETRSVVLPADLETTTLKMRVGLYDETGRLPVTDPPDQVGQDALDAGIIHLDGW